MLKWIAEQLLITIGLIAIAVCIPFAAVSLCRTPLGVQALFWLGPLSAGVLTLIYSQWSIAHRWNRMGRLKQWRENHGGIFHTVPRACGWLFGAILFSYAAEFACAFLSQSAGWLPAATYSPLLFCWLWRRTHV